MKHLVLLVFLALTATGCSAVSKRSLGMPQSTPGTYRSQGQTITWAEKGLSFTAPKDWRKEETNDKDKTSWVGPSHAKILIQVSAYKPEYGGASIEDETEEFYESHKKYGEENLRYREIGGVKGVYYLRSEKGWDERSHAQDQKLAVWAVQRVYKGERQVIFVHVVSPADSFARDRDMLDDLLQSITFSAN
jgi:hypothetical protein